MDTINERISSVFQSSSLSLRKFSEKVGVSPTTINQVCKGRKAGNTYVHQNPKLPLIIGIAKAFPEVNLRWLLTGEGHPLLREAPHLDESVLLD